VNGTGLGPRIRRARERAKLTQRDLAEAVGVDRKTIGNWESGASSPRSRLGRLEAVLAAHGFTPDESASPPAAGADAVIRMIMEVLDSMFSPSVQVQMIRDIIEREHLSAPHPPAGTKTLPTGDSQV
jgi:transcriptional regulator with XRE-family HTH domain